MAYNACMALTPSPLEHSHLWPLCAPERLGFFQFKHIMPIYHRAFEYVIPKPGTFLLTSLDYSSTPQAYLTPYPLHFNHYQISIAPYTVYIIIRLKTTFPTQL